MPQNVHFDNIFTNKKWEVAMQNFYCAFIFKAMAADSLKCDM